MRLQFEFEDLKRDTSSWWYVSRRKLLREAVLQAIRDKRDPRMLDLGCAASMDSSEYAGLRISSAHDSLPVLAFHQMQGERGLVYTNFEELPFRSNSFDVVVAGDILQTVSDDMATLRELRRVLKDGGTVCLTAPAYPLLWGEQDEARGHRRRYTANKLRRKLNNAGLDVTRVSYVVASGFVPSVIERVAKNIFTKSIDRYRQSARRSAMANRGMVLLLDCELALIRFINLPFGTRVVCWARKPSLVSERLTVSAWERQWARHPLPQGSG